MAGLSKKTLLPDCGVKQKEDNDFDHTLYRYIFLVVSLLLIGHTFRYTSSTEIFVITK